MNWARLVISKLFRRLGRYYQLPRPENDLGWPSADIMVSYDSTKRQTIYSKISTGKVLKTVNLDA